MHAHDHSSHEHHHETHDHAPAGSRIIAAGVLLIIAVVTDRSLALPVWQQLLLYLPAYLLAGYDVLREAAEGIAEGDAFNEHFLMAIATIGALAIGFLPAAAPEFAEAVAVMLFFQLGELIEGYAEGRSRKSIADLMDIRPDRATLVRDGKEVEVSPEEVRVGDCIIVRAGERIPLDGRITEGASSLDTVALTGESRPRKVETGDEVVSGCVNLSGLLRIRVTKVYGESTVSKIINLVEHAGEKKSRSETFIARFARIYTPIVTLLALLVAFLPPLFSGDFATTFPTWLYRALTFLVISCPCALVISVPLSFFGGIGGASRAGVLIKGASYMDTLAHLDTVVFDKTGTLTRGDFAVTAVHPERCDERHLLHLAAHVERHSTHPIAAALRAAYPDEADGCQITGVEEYAGMGIAAQVGSQRVAVGNERMMEREGADWHACHKKGTIVHVAIDGQYAGHVVIADRIKEGTRDAIVALKALGVRHTVMLTGDQAEVAAEVARETGVDDFHAELLPADKVSEVERLLPPRDGKHALAFVGDGINDAPVLARADVGIAMGALGSDAALEAADVVLMDDSLSGIARAMGIARRTIRIARQNVAFAIGVKVAVLLLAVCGLATMWMAVFADVGVTVLAVVNALRTLRA